MGNLPVEDEVEGDQREGEAGEGRGDLDEE